MTTLPGYFRKYFGMAFTMPSHASKIIIGIAFPPYFKRVRNSIQVSPDLFFYKSYDFAGTKAVSSIGEHKNPGCSPVVLPYFKIGCTHSFKGVVICKNTISKHLHYFLVQLFMKVTHRRFRYTCTAESFYQRKPCMCLHHAYHHFNHCSDKDGFTSVIDNKYHSGWLQRRGIAITFPTIIVRLLYNASS